MPSESFVYPDIYNFPPFYTKQPNQDTWEKQRQLWADFVIDYARHHRLFLIDINEMTSGKSPLFTNASIKRSLGRDTIQLILERLVESGLAEWESKDTRTRCIVSWRKPEEWANMIFQWAFETGKTNSVCTAYELFNGDDTMDQEFYELPEFIWKRAIDVLVKTGKAQTFASSDGSIGIKFSN